MEEEEGEQQMRTARALKQEILTTESLILDTVLVGQASHGAQEERVAH